MKTFKLILIMLVCVVSIAYAKVWAPGYDENGIDINECAESPGPCPKGMQCVNTIGNFFCIMENGEIPSEHRK